jgi:hypothetical protein
MAGIIRSVNKTGFGRHARARTGDRSHLETLSAVEKQLAAFDFDLRAIRQEAAREAAQVLNTVQSGKKMQRPFQRIVLAQQEKLKRDRVLRAVMAKEKKAEQTRMEEREDQLNRAMQVNSRPTQPGRREHRNKKSVSSAFSFLGFMRPISSAFTSDTVSYVGPKRTAEELDFVPSGKPSLVLSVADARTVRFINNERSFLFQVDTEDGGHYLFQAPTQKEMAKWMNSIGHISEIAAKRRLTWMGNAPRPQDFLSERGKAVAGSGPSAGRSNLSSLLDLY